MEADDPDAGGDAVIRATASAARWMGTVHGGIVVKKLIVVCLSFFVCSMATSADAQSLCAAAKFKASGKNAAAKAGCHSKAFKSGTAVDPACLTKAEGKHAGAYAKAEAKGDCLTTGDETELAAAVDVLVADLVGLLGPSMVSQSKCSAAKIKASGKKAAGKAGCHSKAAKAGVGVDSACLGKAEAKHASAYVKAESKGDCFSTGDEVTAEASVDLFVAGLVALLGPSSCTDGFANGDESDVDCGGPDCGDCVPGDTCLEATDCDSGVCSGDICQAPSCSDGLDNGNETDVDCGGSSCPDCANGDGCVIGGDCQSGVCFAGACQMATCTDGVENGSETGVDCGGPCPACPPFFTFTGVETNLPLVSLAGWSLCHTDFYSDTSTTLASIEAACTGDNLLLACRESGSGTLLLAAHAPRADVLFDTGTGNTPHDANGVGWYFNSSYSWGFARQGDTLNRQACDDLGSNPGERLCWHTFSGSLIAGWRCGGVVGLATTAYERLVFHTP